MVNDLFLNIEIIPCEIIRDEEGLALSSRNAYLSNEEKKDALKISKALELASKEVVKGNKDIKKIEELMGKTLAPLKVEYAKVLRRDFTALNELEIGNSIILICAHVGSTRLIDNIWI
jgi:pantoate--beta-alanine ligase